MTTVVYPAATPSDGLGHVIRCAALTTALEDREVDVEFWLDGPSAIKSVLRAEGIEPRKPPGNSIEESVAIRSPDTLVLDRPAVSGSHLAGLADETTLVVFDDLGGRSLPVDLVVNPSVTAEELPYREAAAVLRGPDYCPLRPQFRTVSPQGEAEGPVLITLGGGNPHGSFDRVVAVVREHTDGAVHAIVGPFADGVTEHPGVSYARSPSDVAERMAAASFAVSGGGLSLYELAACGTPAVAITFDEVHERTIGGFTVRNACLPAGSPEAGDFETTLREAVRRLFTDPYRRAGMAEAASEIVDGRGADRIAEAILTRHP